MGFIAPGHMDPKQAIFEESSRGSEIFAQDMFIGERYLCAGDLHTLNILKVASRKVDRNFVRHPDNGR